MILFCKFSTALGSDRPWRSETKTFNTEQTWDHKIIYSMRNASKEGLCSMSIPNSCSSYSNNIEKPLGPSWEDAGNGAQLSVITPPSQARLRDSFHAFQHFWSLLCGFAQIVSIATATFCHGLISKYIWQKKYDFSKRTWEVVEVKLKYSFGCDVVSI